MIVEEDQVGQDRPNTWQLKSSIDVGNESLCRSTRTGCLAIDEKCK